MIINLAKKALLLGTIFLLLCSCTVNLLPKREQLNFDRTKAQRIFVEIKNEEKIAKYFMNANQRKLYDKLQIPEKEIFIMRYWEALDPNPITKQNEFLEQLRQRIRYSEEHFRSHFSGWKSDQGRIYVKYGEPSDIIMDSVASGQYTGAEYEIWKYRMDMNMDETFLFLEVQSYGEKRLIYSQTDNEVSRTSFDGYYGDVNVFYLINAYE